MYLVDKRISSDPSDMKYYPNPLKNILDNEVSKIL